MRTRTLLIASVLFTALVAGGVVLASRGDRGQAAAPGPDSMSAPTISDVRVTPIPARMIPGQGLADREVTITGSGYFGTSFGPFVRLNGKDAVAVVMDAADPAHRLLAYAPPGLTGRVEVVVENPDRQSARAFADF
jgi:hypothetical protein